MEFVLTGTALLKALGVGLAIAKAKDKWAWTAEDAEAVLKLIDDGGQLAGLLRTPGSAPRDLVGKHTLIATQAFGAACLAHWGGSKTMAPFATKKSLLPWGEDMRKKDWEQRLGLAMTRLGRSDPQGGPANADSIAFLDAIVHNPIASPVYAALWSAFTDEKLLEGEEVPPLEFTRESRRLEFERAFRIEYAEGVAKTPGFSSAALALAEGDAPRMLRELIVRWVSTWGSLHVFGPEARGIPPMPLEGIYVEPWASYTPADAHKPVRSPVRELVLEQLKTRKIVIVRGDFGHGKSLTAKTLALGWAREFLGGPNPSVITPYPVFVRCGDDMLAHTITPFEAVRNALQRQARAAGCDRPDHDLAHRPPAATDTVRYLFDGLDEVALGSSQVQTFLRELHRMLGEGQKAIVFSRRAVVPQPKDLPSDTIVLDVQPFDEGQVEQWLAGWNVMSNSPPVEVSQLAPRGLAKLAKTPILLFMIAMTWSSENGATSNADLYERFLVQIARGKCEYDQECHELVARAGDELLRRLRDRKLLLEDRRNDLKVNEATDEGGRPAAMLWLLSRIAWEARRQATINRHLTVHDVSTILLKEIGLEGQAADTIDAVKVGVLLALNADQHGRNHEILFGHKSFHEFLVARYWDNALERIVFERSDNKREQIIKSLLGAPLLEEDDSTLDLLLQRLNAPSWDSRRTELIRFCQDEANSETPRFRSEPHTWRNDDSPWFRLAALAIGSHLAWHTGEGEARGLDLDSGGFGIRASVYALTLQERRIFVVAPGLRMHRLTIDASLVVLDLRNSIITGADFAGARVEQLILDGATLRGAVMRNMQTEFARFAGADLSYTSLDNARWFYVNFSGAILNGASLMGANLMRANLKGASLVGASLGGATLIEAELDGADLTNANVRGAVVTLSGLRRVVVSSDQLKDLRVLDDSENDVTSE